MDNKDYIVSIENKGIKLNITKNETVIEELPSKFDARDMGWITPLRIQGDNDDCWAFATVASIETALLKSTGQTFNLSENYVQTLQLKYSKYGDIRISLTGFAYSGLGHALSWVGMLPSDSNYDDRGTIADTDLSSERIHVQDAMIIHGGRNDTIEQLKKAILKYGAVTVQLIISESTGEINSTGDDIAIMEHGIHFITLIGWDDDYVYNSSSYPEGRKGIWIVKDSMYGYSTNFYDDEILSVDYYAIVPQNQGIAYIFENNNDYHVNYQTDITGLTGFDENYTIYSNEFTSKYTELIAAVGTYFNDSDINYSFDIYVNDELVHTQNGTSEFAGFRTIILDKYIPINEGDKFKVVFKNNALPYQAFSRQHYMQGMSLISNDNNNWKDISLENRTVCLKVYTLQDNNTEEITKLNKTITTLNKTINEQNQTIHRLNEVINNTNQTLKDYINNLQNKIKLLQDKVENLTKAINNKETTIENITNATFELKQVTELFQKEIDDLQDLIDLLNKTSIIQAVATNSTVGNSSVRISLNNRLGEPIINAPINITDANGTSIASGTTNTNGTLIILLNTKAGTENITINYAGNTNKTPSNTTISITTSKNNVTLTVNPIKGIIGENITLTAQILDKNSNPVSGGNLVFKLNGKTLRSDGRFDSNTTPYKFSVNNGIVTVNITADFYLRNIKNLTASYSGSYQYEETKSETVTAQIQKRQAQILLTASPDNQKQYKT